VPELRSCSTPLGWLQMPVDRNAGSLIGVFLEPGPGEGTPRDDHQAVGPGPLHRGSDEVTAEPTTPESLGYTGVDQAELTVDDPVGQLGLIAFGLEDEPTVVATIDH